MDETTKKSQWSWGDEPFTDHQEIQGSDEQFPPLPEDPGAQANTSSSTTGPGTTQYVVTNSHSVLQAHAASYSSAGFDVGPCHAESKRPLYNWKNPEDRKTCTLAWHIEKFGLDDTGLCIFTGSTSNVTVVDVDNREQKLNKLHGTLASETDVKKRAYIQKEIDDLTNSGPLYQRAVEICEASGAAKAITQSGGCHYYFVHHPDLTTRSNYVPCIDVRNDGGLVVAPPTVGVNGSYTWVDGRSDYSIRPDVPDELLALFNVTAENIEAPPEHDFTIPVFNLGSSPSQAAIASKKSPCLIKPNEYVGAGKRDDRIFRHLLSRCGSGMAMEDAISEVMGLNIQWDREWNRKAIQVKAKHVYQNYPAQKPANALTTVIAASGTSHFNIANIQEFHKAMNQIRAGVGRSFQIKMAVAHNTIKLLHSTGKLYNDRSDHTAYYFHNSNKQLIPIREHDHDFKLLAADLCINASEAIFKYLVNSLWAEAFKSGTPIVVRRNFHYDQPRNTLYLSMYNGLVVRITKDAVDIVDNGTDGMLFTHDPRKESFQYIPGATGLSMFNRYLIDGVNFAKDGILCIDEMRSLLRYYIYSIFFTGPQSDRPLLVFVGEKGSTKTANGRNIGMILYGGEFGVTPVTSSKEDDFDVTIINSRFVVLDNVDSRIKWLDDKLAQIATGGTLRRRELYTTADMKEYPLDCNVLITSRTPKFCRDDVADRLIVLKTERRTQFVAKQALISKLLGNRNQIMSELINELQRIVKILHTAPAQMDTQFRIADFASFCLKIANHDGHKDQVECIFNKLTREQSRLMLETNEADFIELLNDWLDIQGNDEKHMTISELCRELNQLAFNKDMDFYYGKRPRVLANKMRDILPNLQHFFDVDVTTVGGKTAAYRFRRQDGASELW